MADDERISGPVPLRWPVVCRLESGNLLVCGGLGEDGPSSFAFGFDARSYAWAPIADMRRPRFGHAVLPLPGGLAMALGGQDGAERSSCELWDGAQWRELEFPGLPNLRHFSLSLLDASTALVTGGEDSHGVSSRGSWLIDIELRKVLATGQMRRPKAHHASVLLEGEQRVLAVGPTETVAEVWDSSTNSWADCGEVVGRSGAQLVAAGKGVWLLGGQEPEPMTIAEKWNGARFERQADLPLPCGGVPVVVPSPTRLVIAGAGEENDHVLIYDDATQSWTTVQSSKRYAHGLGVVSAEAVLVVGGMLDTDVKVLRLPNSQLPL